MEYLVKVWNGIRWLVDHGWLPSLREYARHFALIFGMALAMTVVGLVLMKFFGVAEGDAFGWSFAAVMIPYTFVVVKELVRISRRSHDEGCHTK